jgi:hypothetical protein
MENEDFSLRGRQDTDAKIVSQATNKEFNIHVNK